MVGIDRAADPAIHDRPLAEGAPLGTGDDDGALISASLAHEDGLGVGATITLLGDPAAAPTVLRVVGVAARPPATRIRADGRWSSPSRPPSALFATDRVTAVDLLVADGADATAVIADLERRLTVEPYTLSTPADLAAGLEAATEEIRAAIALVAAVALFGGRSSSSTPCP